MSEVYVLDNLSGAGVVSSFQGRCSALEKLNRLADLVLNFGLLFKAIGKKLDSA